MKVTTFAHVKTMRDGAVVAHWAHNPKVAGSSPAPATERKLKVNIDFQLFILHKSPCQTPSHKNIDAVAADFRFSGFRFSGFSKLLISVYSFFC